MASPPTQFLRPLIKARSIPLRVALILYLLIQIVKACWPGRDTSVLLHRKISFCIVLLTGLCPKIREDFFNLILIGFWCSQITPAELSLVKTIVGRIVIRGEAMRDVSLRQNGIQKLSFKFILENSCLNVALHFPAFLLRIPDVRKSMTLFQFQGKMISFPIFQPGNPYRKWGRDGVLSNDSFEPSSLMLKMG